ncbi:CHASE2 domain-containing protein [Oscillatoria sp. CS-180]|uniref:CHASE2 domain-containing protein n=1 Tax=Oscillatoria sp. CS-180 TaxID=3021720 RepID=UPI00232BD95E|nr:CHASE2 domain-containing protein [Oscillatoria sp. CS-180]MDB9529436.1 CHASE2 domain-containing protein [Oscillatoria sp. CS-180]
MVTPPSPKGRNSPPWVQKPLDWMSRVCRPPVISTVSTAIIVLGLRAVGALQGLELGVYDQMMRLRSAPTPDDRILVVGISEADIQARQEWPIQDSTLADVLEIVLAGNPRAVGLDIFRDVPIGEGQAALVTQLESSDRVFPVCKMSDSANPGVPPPQGVPEEYVGFSDLLVDQGGILRRSLLVAAPPEDSDVTNTHLCNSPDAQLLSLSLQLALSYLAADGIQPEFTANQELKLGDTVLSRLGPNTGSYRNINAQGYQILLNYQASDGAIPEVSLSEVLAGQVSPDQFRDRIVLIGATTPEAKDVFYTPFSGGLRDSQTMTGVMVHAQATSQILRAVLNDRPLLWGWSTLGEAGWIIAWGLGGALFAWYVRRPLPYAVGAVVLLGGLYGVCYLFFLQGGWIPLVPPALSLLLASGGVVLLDRFNKSDYGQAVYKQMKSLLRLEIEIDQTRVGEQVAEITDTDYFARLQSQAKELRDKRSGAATTNSQKSGDDRPTRPSSTPSQDADSTISVDDYVDSLKQKARNMKSSETHSDHDRT